MDDMNTPVVEEETPVMPEGEGVEKPAVEGGDAM